MQRPYECVPFMYLSMYLQAVQWAVVGACMQELTELIYHKGDVSPSVCQILKSTNRATI